MVPISVPPTAGLVPVLQSAGAAAGGRVLLLQGAAAGRAMALLLGAAAPGRVAQMAAAASPRRPRCTSGCENQPSHGDGDAKVLGEIMQEMSLGVVVQGDEELLRRLATMAKEAGELLATMTQGASSPLPHSVHQEIILVSASFSELEGHCELGYTTDADVLAATHGVKKMAEIFLGSRGATEGLGPGHRIVYGGGKGGSTQDSKAAYLRQLATAFSILVRDVKNAYLQSEDQGVAKVLGEILQEMSLGVVVQGENELLRRLSTMAKEAGELLATMIKEASSPLPDHVYQELILVNATFTEVDGHCELGYVTDASVVAATAGVKRMAVVFLGSGAAEKLGPYPTIVYGGGGKGATQDPKAAYLRQLATAFSIVIRDVKNAYLRRPGGRD